MSDTAYPAGPIFTSREGPVARLILNRPDKHNAMTLAMWRDVPRLLAELDAAPDVKVVIVQGAGLKAFSTGADISEFEAIHATPESSRAFGAAVRAAFHAVEVLSKPTIAMVRGLCVGGGCGLALACDLRFAETGAHFGITPAKLGLVYGFDDTKRLVDTVGPAKARDILFSGRLIDAAEALRIGLVDRLCAAAELEAVTFRYATEVCAGSQYTIRMAKRIIQSIMDGTVTEPPDIRRLTEEGFAGEDFREGCRAFLDKRKPSFTFH